MGEAHIEKLKEMGATVFKRDGDVVEVVANGTQIGCGFLFAAILRLR